MWVYKNNTDNSARFLLGEAGNKTLICIGINPSTAIPTILDNTLTNVKNISSKKGFDGWIMLNVYPQRSTDPNGLHVEMDLALHQENIRYISEYVKENPIFDVWASWGNLIGIRPYLKECLKDIYQTLSDYNPNWLVLGDLTLKGHPHHPLYIAHKSPFNSFDSVKYFSNE